MHGFGFLNAGQAADGRQEVDRAGRRAFDPATANAVRPEKDPRRPQTALKIASLEESVGKFWFGEGAKVVMECGFVGFLGAETVRFSGDQF